MGLINQKPLQYNKNLKFEIKDIKINEKVFNIINKPRFFLMPPLTKQLIKPFNFNRLCKLSN